MRLYYSPGACSLSQHIIAREAGLDIELEKVVFGKDGRTTEPNGEDFFKVNPKGGYVPALKLDSGEVMTENIAIAVYLADQNPAAKLLPSKETADYYRTIEWLAFISTELHKSFGPLFNPHVAEDAKKNAIEKITKRQAYIDSALSGKEFLLGNMYTVADAYLYTILRWNEKFSISLEENKNIVAFMERMKARPAVAKALEEEGLV